MQRIYRPALVLMIVAALASNAMAKGHKKGNDDTPASTAVNHMIKSVTGLTDDQTKKFDALKDEYNPKLKDAFSKEHDVLTQDQIKAGKDAAKQAKADGKKGKELKQAVADAQKITADQQSKLDAAKKATADLTKELHDKVLANLTEPQKAQVGTGKHKHKHKSA